MKTRKSNRPIVIYGEALFGPRWKAPLGRSIGIPYRTIKRYAKGETTPPPGVLDDCRALMRDRGIVLRKMAGD